MTENLPKQNAAPRPCAARRPSHVAIRGKRNISGTANLLVISCRVLPWSTTAASPSNVLSSTLTRTALCPRLVAIYVVAGLCGSARHRDGLKAAWVRMSSTAGRPAPPQAPWPRLARRTDRSCQGGLPRQGRTRHLAATAAAGWMFAPRRPQSSHPRQEGD
jgi:hypothetical protein